MALQFAAERWTGTADSLGLPLHEAADGRFLLPTTALFGVLYTRYQQGRAAEELAYRFHQSLAEMIVAGCERARREAGLSTVALSGGVFQNLLLMRLVKERLERRASSPCCTACCRPTTAASASGRPPLPCTPCSGDGPHKPVCPYHFAPLTH